MVQDISTNYINSLKPSGESLFDDLIKFQKYKLHVNNLGGILTCKEYGKKEKKEKAGEIITKIIGTVAGKIPFVGSFMETGIDIISEKIASEPNSDKISEKIIKVINKAITESNKQNGTDLPLLPLVEDLEKEVKEKNKKEVKKLGRNGYRNLKKQTKSKALLFIVAENNEEIYKIKEDLQQKSTQLKINEERLQRLEGMIPLIGEHIQYKNANNEMSARTQIKTNRGITA